MHGKINLDFQDVKTVLKDGGVAIMSTGYGSGEGRVTKAIDDALHSPLLNDNDIYHSKKVLLHIIHSGSDCENATPLMMDEMNEINDFMERIQTDDVETKWGYSADASLKDKVKVTILATGFGIKDINSAEMDARIEKQDEASRRAAEAAVEKAAEDADRRQRFYGPTTKNGYIRKPVYSFIFHDEDLDNDDIISNVESLPTYKRKKGSTDKFRADVADAAPAVGETITFDFE